MPGIRLLRLHGRSPLFLRFFCHLHERPESPPPPPGSGGPVCATSGAEAAHSPARPSARNPLQPRRNPVPATASTRRRRHSDSRPRPTGAPPQAHDRLYSVTIRRRSTRPSPLRPAPALRPRVTAVAPRLEHRSTSPHRPWLLDTSKLVGPSHHTRRHPRQDTLPLNCVCFVISCRCSS
ncbi:proline-rich receptor-like protein kinase PERK8 [Iris pallida]|uniref:Proline-rich receptor-like protein kinase PERK8 n=1 Tax=Iris pallida TaxID=29817 RepID=A0AAX6FL04_IRIPA|nr:proline-rich receptor-like protein kinase PERK8 [Iris pallida]